MFNKPEYLTMLSETKVQRGILVFAGPMDTHMLNKINSVLDDHNKNTFFYMVYKEMSSASYGIKPDDAGPYQMSWNQVQKNTHSSLECKEGLECVIGAKEFYGGSYSYIIVNMSINLF